jgi:hypothetical protein
LSTYSSKKSNPGVDTWRTYWVERKRNTKIRNRAFTLITAGQANNEGERKANFMRKKE